MKKMFMFIGIAMLCLCSNAYGVKGMKWGVRKSSYTPPKTTYSTRSYSPRTYQTKTGHGINGCGVKGCHGACCSGSVGTNGSIGGHNADPLGFGTPAYLPPSAVPKTHTLSYNEKLSTIRLVNSLLRTAIYARNSYTRSESYKQKHELECKKFETLRTKVGNADATVVRIMNNLETKGLNDTKVYAQLRTKHKGFQNALNQIDSSIARLNNGTYDLRTDDEKDECDDLDAKIAKIKLLVKKVENDEALTTEEFNNLNNLIKEVSVYCTDKGFQVENDIV